MLVNRAGIHKMLVRIAMREDPDQTTSSDLDLGMCCFTRPFVACSSCLLMFLCSLYCKQYYMDQDQTSPYCLLLIKISSDVHLNRCSRCKKQTFSGQQKIVARYGLISFTPSYLEI